MDEPLAKNDKGEKVFLKDIWPTQQEVNDTIAACISPDMFRKQYAQRRRRATREWNAIPVKGGELFDWSDEEHLHPGAAVLHGPVARAQADPADPRRRVLVMVGDSVTTDHISPAGSIKKDSPGGQVPDGARRAADGLQQLRLAPRQRPRDDPRHVRQHPPAQPARPRHRRRRDDDTSADRRIGEEIMPIYDASMKYQAEGVPLVVLAGKDYGMGSSRDWAAKGTYLLGVKAVIAESFERIHRSNLVGMGVLPLQFQSGPEPRVAGPDRRRARSRSRSTTTSSRGRT